MSSILSPSLLPARLLATASLVIALWPAWPSRAQGSDSMQQPPDAGLSHQAGTITQAPASLGVDISPASSGLQQAASRGDLRRDDARLKREQQRSQAQAALNRNHPAQALAIAESALQAAPGDARLRFLQGVALNQLGRLDDAEGVFRALVDEYPELPEPYNNLAVVLAAQGRLEDARQALEEAIHAVPGYAVAYENLGELHLQLARRNWQRARELAPASKALSRKLKQLESLDPALPAQTPGQSPASPRQSR